MNTVWNDLRALQRIPWPDRALLLRTLGWLLVWMLAVRTVPLRRIERWGAHTPTAVSVPPARELARVGWAVDSVAGLLPKATCLPRALTARSLLGDVPSTLRVGFVRRGEALLGHAWLTVGERVVVGDDGALERYTPIALRAFPEETRGLRS